MSLGKLVVAAVRVEGRTKSDVARSYGVSRQWVHELVRRWVHELVRRYDAEGETCLEPRSKRPHGSPQQIPVDVEEDIVRLRKKLEDRGLDAGAHTIAYDLEKARGGAPAPSTIWRILSRRGFVIPQPQKRPRSSFVRFQ